MGEQVKHQSRIRERHPNSKFCPGSKAFDDRKTALAEIMKKIGEGQRGTPPQ